PPPPPRPHRTAYHPQPTPSPPAPPRPNPHYKRHPNPPPPTRPRPKVAIPTPRLRRQLKHTEDHRASQTLPTQTRIRSNPTHPTRPRRLRTHLQRRGRSQSPTRRDHQDRPHRRIAQQLPLNARRIPRLIRTSRTQQRRQGTGVLNTRTPHFQCLPNLRHSRNAHKRPTPHRHIHRHVLSSGSFTHRAG